MLLHDGKIDDNSPYIFLLFNIIFVIVYFINRTSTPIGKKEKEEKNVALDCIIDVTAAIKCIGKGQTIHNMKFALFICSFCLFGMVVAGIQHVLMMDDPLSKWEIIHRNYTIYCTRVQCLTTIVIMLIIVLFGT